MHNHPKALQIVKFNFSKKSCVIDLFRSKQKKENIYVIFFIVMHVQYQARPHFDEQMVSENLNCHFVKA